MNLFRSRLINYIQVVFVVVVILPFSTSAQSLRGIILDEKTGKPAAGAIIQVENTFLVTTSNDSGQFILSAIPSIPFTIEITHISYEKNISTITATDSLLTFRLIPATYLSEEVTITATRADNNSAVAFTNIEKEEIEKRNLGQDMPYLLNLSPSIVSFSDAGAGVGYSGLRIRGSDGTHVNVTINDVPVNDAESHMVYWVDLPDLATSVESIQLQRGIGTSTNGSGAFGASINILTNQVHTKPFAEFNSSAGSFNTFKNTISLGSGLLNKKWAVETRLSKISSDGYIDRASSDLKSVFVSGGYYGTKTTLRAVFMSGKEKTYQAWLGVPEDSLQTNRTFNPSGMYWDSSGATAYYDNQTDNYRQDYYQLLFAHQFNSTWTLHAALHYTKGKGYYEEYAPGDAFANYGMSDVIIPGDTITNSDFIRQRWLDNDFYGFTGSVNYSHNQLDLQASISGSKYNGDHFGKLIWSKDQIVDPSPKEYYFDASTKFDYATFIKCNYSLSDKMKVYADLQYRHVEYDFIGNDSLANPEQQHSDLSFFNPKAGIVIDQGNGHRLYASVGVGHKEPVRDDYINASPAQPKPELLIDYEAGYQYHRNKVEAAVNIYYMDYKDQLILTGKINNDGEYTRQNVPESYRTGIELEAGYRFTAHWMFNFNFSANVNKIKNYQEYLYDENYSKFVTDYSNTTIAFSPPFVGAGILSWKANKHFSAELTGKYVGEQFLDNTQTASRKMKPYFVNDFRIQYSLSPKPIREIVLNIMINNFLDSKYVSNGYTYSYIYGGDTQTFNNYYPQAGINFMAGVCVKF